MDTIIKPLSGLDGFKNIIKSIDTDKNVLVNGVTDSQKNHLIYSILKMQKVPGLIVTYSDIRAMNIISDLNTFGCDKVYLYPAKDLLFYNVDIKSSNIYNSRIKVIKELINNEVDCIVVLSIDSLLDKLMPRYKFEEYIYELSRAQIFDLDTFINKLVSMGYERVDLVTTPGEFAVRGDILDIYAKTQDNPYRIEVFDDRVEDIRVFDVSTQRSVNKLNSVTIYPARELIYDKALLTKAIECMRRDLDIRKNDYEQKGMHEELNNLEISVEMDINCIETETGLNNLDRYIHYFYKDAESILDYMIKDTMIFIDEPKRIIKHKDSILSEFNESIKERILKGRLLKGHDKVIFNYEDVLDKLSRFKNMLFSSFMSNIKDFKIDTNVTLEVTPIPTDGSRLDLLLDSLSYYVKRKYTVVILAGLKSKALKLISLLNDKGIKSTYKNSLEDVDCGLSWVFVTKGYLYEGFEYKESKFAVISFKKESYKRTRSKHKENNNVKKIGGFRELNIGDYVVHNAHGIGVYHGIEQVNADGISKDYLKIEYAGGNILYVSTTQMEQVQKYVGAEKGSLKLNKLGGSDWSKTKARARRAVEIAAKDMISLYARRELSKGFAFSKDLVWQQEFEAKFPFQETLDQLNAIKEVKQDMESSKVMDRLICGDVGYGKTEVALRAAFKAVQDSKQVVCLVPTTVLAQQHYNTFTSRMSDYPITVELLSRFKDKKSQKETIKKMKTGEVDIVIGTHRLISKDVMFKDLGLLIIDEEQRFGVRQKEMLKQLMIDVDVISLSATPIPRTLHMSLSGIRDISILNNPPQDRIPVQTYVMEYDDGFIREAIMREMSRGGQIYYVNNRIENIEISVLKINRLIPEARVGVAHGRMSEIELEEVMFNFIERNIDIH